MRIEFIILLALAVGATFFVIVVAIGLLVNKWVELRQARSREKLYQSYSAMFAEFLLQPIEEPPEGARSVAMIERYEELIEPVKNGLSWSTPSRKSLHRQTIRQVLIDFSRDLSGESMDRLVYFFESFAFADDVIKLLGSKKWWVRAQAARDLGLLRARNSLPGLTIALQDEHPDVQSEAMQALVMLVGVEGLRTIFRLTDKMSRWATLQLSVIVKQFEEESFPYLIEALQSPNTSVVLFAIEMLAEIGFVSAVEPLMEMVRTYPNVVIRSRAAIALGRLGDQRAEPLLHELLSNPYPAIRASATRALERVGSPASVPLLRERLKGGSIPDRVSAARALAKSGEAGMAELRRLVEGSDDLRKRIALQVLEEVEGVIVDS